MVGIPAAIANAVFHAPGWRIRELPIRAEDLLRPPVKTRLPAIARVSCRALEPLPPACQGGKLMRQLGEHLERRERCCLRTVFEGGSPGSDLLEPGVLTAEREGTFLHPVPLPVRLVLFGDGPEVEPVTAIAGSLA